MIDLSITDRLIPGRTSKSCRFGPTHQRASGLPRVLSWLGRLSCRNTGSQLNGRHPRPVNAYIVLVPGNDTS